MNGKMNETTRKYMQDLLMKLLNIPSPTGYCMTIMDELAKEAEKLGFTMERTPKGAGIIRIAGASDHADNNQSGNVPSGRVIALSAHVDTLGAMVRSVKENGTLAITPVGGYMMHSIENEYCLIHTRSGATYSGTLMTTKPSVHVFGDARTMQREESVMRVRIDENVSTKDDVKKLGIETGDFISFDARPVALPNGYIKSRHLDDKAGVAAVFGMLHTMRGQSIQPAHPLVVFISNYEEVGHGSAFIPADVTEIIAVDMGALGDDLSGNELTVSICAKDSSGPYDYEMTSKLVELAKRHELPYAVDIYPHYGSDASAALRGGSNVRAALLGPGVHASHAMERTHRDAVEATAKLLLAYVTEA